MTNPTNPLLAALEPFALIAEHDIGEDEADTDLYRPMTFHNRVPAITVGHLRRAAEALSSAPAVGDAVALVYENQLTGEKRVRLVGDEVLFISPGWTETPLGKIAHPTAAVAGEGDYCEKCDDSGYQFINGKQDFCDCACGHDAMDQAEGKGLHTPSLSQPAGDALRERIRAGLLSWVSSAPDFSMSSAMIRDATDHILAQPVASTKSPDADGGVA